MMTIKENLYSQCLEFINGRLIIVQNNIKGIQESLLSETKSSAGDKHETGRAMLQLEREKAGVQLAEINKVKESLARVDTESKSEIIGLGSLVYTSQFNYYIAISAGELKSGVDTFYAISPSTPIGRLLVGKKVEDRILFRTQKFTIRKVL